MSLRVLKLSRQPYYRWRKQQVTEAELVEAHRANALFDAHRDDDTFGYRLLADEAAVAGGEVMCRRTAWRICRDNQWFSAFGKKQGRNGKRPPGPPVHDDLVQRDFSADDVNELWLTDITEHPTDESKLYLCAVKDVFSGRIVGYSMDSRMKSRLAVNALDNAVIRRGDTAGCIVHSDRGSQFRSRKFVRALHRHHLIGSMGASRRCRRQRREGVLLRAAAEERPEPQTVAHSRGAPDRDHHLDRTNLPPPPPAGQPGPVDPPIEYETIMNPTVSLAA